MGLRALQSGDTTAEEAELLALVEPSLRALKAAALEADRDARRGVDSGAGERFLAAFAACEVLSNQAIGDAATVSEPAKARAGARLQAEILPFLLLAENGGRWYAKPRGYAGDYLTIARIYDDEARGTGRVGELVDRACLGFAAARAVKNRRPLLAREIAAAIERRRADGPARITSLACGPAQEVFDVFASIENPGALRATLVDLDFEALAHVADRRDRARLRGSIDLVNENLVHVAKGKRALAAVDQDLVYSIGLIDYFSDAFVVRLLDAAHAMLRPGGRALFGNFHPRNPTKALMDHVLEWKLHHRTEDDMHRLFAASAFGRGCTKIVYEVDRINLFAECAKD